MPNDELSVTHQAELARGILAAFLALLLGGFALALACLGDFATASLPAIGALVALAISKG